MADLTPSQAEIQLQRFAALVASSDDAIVAKTLEGTIQSWNPAAERIFGYTAEEMIGQPIFKLIPPELQSEEHEILARIRQGQHVAHYETNRVTKDGRRITIALTISPIFDGKGNLIGASAIKRDITAQRSLEQQLRQAQKMEALGQLAGGIAHDFNNILTIIEGFTSFGIRSVDPNSEVHSDLLGIRAAAERATRLTQQLLAFSRQQPVQAEALDLAEVIADTAVLLRRVLGEHIELNTSGGRGVSFVHADRGQITQVLLNLAVNARDAMPEGGKLTITTRAEAEKVWLEVTDSGLGMDTATMARIFEPFFTTKPRGQGTGLGLSTVFGIVQQSGGTIEAESAPGEGSTFLLSFPRVALTAPSPTDAEEPSVRGHESVLLVEDDPDLTDLAARALRDFGYKVTQTGGPGEAMVAYAQGGSFDLLVTDVVMPGMNGRILAERLRAENPRLAVLLISGYTGHSLASGETGPYPLLNKPFTPGQLVNAVRTVLDGRLRLERGGAA